MYIGLGNKMNYIRLWNFSLALESVYYRLTHLIDQCYVAAVTLDTMDKSHQLSDILSDALNLSPIHQSRARLRLQQQLVMWVNCQPTISHCCTVLVRHRWLYMHLINLNSLSRQYLKTADETLALFLLNQTIQSFVGFHLHQKCVCMLSFFRANETWSFHTSKAGVKWKEE